MARRAAAVLLAAASVAAALAAGGWLAAAEAQEAEPGAGSAERGEELYAASCASCHAAGGEGTPDGPSLLDAGAASADFQLRTGRMPMAQPAGQQPLRKPPAFDDGSIRDLVAYVASLGDGPAIPEVAVDPARLSRGQRLYVENCAPCHGATAAGGAVGGGALAPALDAASPLIVAEAMLTGPGQMPAFDLPAADRDAVATYVDHLQRSVPPGGFSIGQIGPVPEGLVAWLVGMGLLALVAFLVGREWQRGEHGGEDRR